MDIRIFVLLVFVGVLGSFAEARAGFVSYPRNGGVRRGVPPVMEYAASRSKREIDDSNGETANSSETTAKSTTTSATTMTSSSTTDPTTTDPTTTDPTTTDPTTTDPTTTDPTTTDPTTPSTTPTTEPTTTPTTTTEATTPTTTPPSTTQMSTTPATTPTTPTTTPTTPTTTPTTASSAAESTASESTKATNDILSRSNFDEPESEDSPKKPGSSSKDDAAPTPGPYFGSGAFGPYFGPGFGSGFDPYFGYPGTNFIPGSSPNYGWPDANSGLGFASAGASAGATSGASAGSFAGGYSGMGYPMAGYPMTGYPMTGYPMTGYPTAGFPTAGVPTAGFPTAGFPAAGSTNMGSRGGFQDNSADQTGYNPGGIDPLYNPGFDSFFPGQLNSFDMYKQIEAQIRAQHEANMEFHNRLASEAANYGGGGVPQVASASIGLGPNGGFQAGHISPAAPGIESRFAEDLPAPSGNGFGVFSSSSSSSMTGPDGKQINRKSSITGVNDNGKVSYRVIHD